MQQINDGALLISQKLRFDGIIFRIAHLSRTLRALFIAIAHFSRTRRELFISIPH
jgi:hypothetical protein